MRDSLKNRASLLGQRLARVTFAGGTRASLSLASILRSCGIFFATAVLVYLSHNFTREAGHVASVWPLNAFVVVMLMRRPRSEWASIFVASFGANALVNFFMQGSPLTGILLSGVNALEVYVCASLLQGRGPRFDITRGRDLLRFIAIGGILAPAVSAVLAALVMAGTQPISQTWSSWYVADALGMLIFAPALMAFAEQTTETQRPASLRSIVACVAALLVFLMVVFTQSSFPLLFLIPPILTLVTFELGMKGAAGGVLLTAVIAISFTVAGYGPAMLVQGSDSDRAFLLQAFLATLTLSKLPIAAALAERARGRVAIERAKAEAEEATARALQSEQHYRTLAEYSTDIVLRFGKGGIITYASPACRILGIEPEQAIGRSTIDFAAPESREAARQAVDAHFSGAELDTSMRREFRVARADGSSIWLEGRPSIIRDESGAPIEVVSTYRDVTARRELEEHLAKARMEAEEGAAAARISEMRYRMLADSSSDAITRAGLDGVWTFLSPSTIDILGYDPEEMVGKKWRDFAHPDDVQGVKRFFTELIALGPAARPQTYQYRGIHKDGRHIWLECNPRIVFDSAGNLVEIQDSIRDITTRKELEDQLAAAQREAVAAAAHQTEFVANMSHELRTPLSSIIGFARLLSDSPRLAQADRRYIEIISNSSEGLLGLVNDVLDFSSLEAGSVSLERRQFNLSSTMRRVLDTLQIQADRKGLSLRLVVEGPVAGDHVGDEARLNQVVLNLVGNALKFTERGEVTVRVTCAARNGARQSVRVEVEDTGIGIPAEKLPILFGRFSQVDSSISRRFGGSGLGLAISRHLVELMGGTIGVTSTEGVGSKFWFEFDLEIASADHQASESASGPRRDAGSGMRILVVDDVDLNRELVVAQLAGTGHVVETAHDGQTAIEMVRAKTYDLVLMDVQMPGLDGRAATRAIRQIEGRQEIPIVAMTAQALAPQIEACLAAGMNDHLAKPFRIEALLGVVERWNAGETRKEDETDSPVMDDLRTRFVKRSQDDCNRLIGLRDEVGEAVDAERSFLIHRLAGTAGTLGFHEVSDIAGELDMRIADGRPVSGAEVDVLVAALLRMVGVPSSKPAAPLLKAIA